MGDIEQKIKEAVYESGALPTTTNCVIQLMHPNRALSDCIALATVLVDESDISNDIKIRETASRMANCILSNESQVYGVTIWFYSGTSGADDKRFASVSRDNFNTNKTIEVSCRMKDLISSIRSKLKETDRFELKLFDLSYLNLNLSLKMRVHDQNMAPEALRSTIFEIAESITKKEPLAGTLNVTVYPQNLTTRIDCQKVMQSKSIEFETPSEVLSRSNHL